MADSLTDRIVAANEALLVRGDLDSIAQFFAEGYVVHLTEPAVGRGHDFVKRAVSGWRRAFTDLTVRVVTFMETEDKICWQRTLEGRHLGTYHGFVGTKQSVRWRDLVVTRFKDDLIAEEWLVSELAERLLVTRKK